MRTLQEDSKLSISLPICCGALLGYYLQHRHPLCHLDQHLVDDLHIEQALGVEEEELILILIQ